MSLGDWVKVRREEIGLSQRQLALKIGIGNGTLARIERLGDVTAQDRVVMNMAEMFDENIIRVLYESDRFGIDEKTAEMNEKWQALSDEEKEAWLTCYPKKD